MTVTAPADIVPRDMQDHIDQEVLRLKNENRNRTNIN